MNEQSFQTVSGLSHTAIRTRNILDSVRYYTDILGMKEAFRMHREDGSLATVYVYIAPGQYLELFSDGTREGISGPDVVGFSHICLMTRDIRKSYEAVKTREDRWILKSKEESPSAGCSGPMTRTEPGSRSWKCLRNRCRRRRTDGWRNPANP